MTFLSSSSFFLHEYLSSRINDNNYTQAQLTYAVNKNYDAALLKESKKFSYGSDDWQIIHRKLARTISDSALILGQWNQNLVKKTSSEEYTHLAIMWFKQAIRLGSQEATVALAQLYFDRGDIVQSQKTLVLLSNLSTENKSQLAAQNLHINLAIHLGDINAVKLLVESDIFKVVSSNKSDYLLTEIKRYNVLGDAPKISSTQPMLPSISCITSVQLFATNLSHLRHLERLIDSFQSQQVLSPFICLPTPQYISKHNVECLAETKQAISCNEARWQVIAQQVDTRHIGLMLDEGGANVHLGIVYFDQDDNAEVFSHELSHLLGFVDEYPLAKGHIKCQAVQEAPFSHNIAVLHQYYQGEKQAVRERILSDVAWAHHIKESTPILQADIEGGHKRWLLGTPAAYKTQVGIHLAESCQKAEQQNHQLIKISSAPLYAAFKPLSQGTQLKYFANSFPAEYLTMLKESPEVYRMPSFHYNIALALYNQGKIIDAKYWLAQSAKWETIALRKSNILKGNF